MSDNGYIVGSNLEKALKAGYFVATGELGPPQSADRHEIEHKAQFLKGIVESVNITDNQTAVVRMSSIAVAVMLMELGIEPNIQMTCRDRNRIAIQSDLLGAYALGCRNLLCLTGDHQTFGNHPQSKNVHDLDSISLLQVCRGMRDQKVFQCGDAIKGQEPRFFLGAASNPFADPFEFRPYRLGKKARAGADFIQTQLIFNVPKFREFMRQVVDLGMQPSTWLPRCLVWRSIRNISSVWLTRQRACPHWARSRPWTIRPKRRPPGGHEKRPPKTRGSRFVLRSSTPAKKWKAWRASTSWPLSGKRPWTRSSGKPRSAPSMTRHARQPRAARAHRGVGYEHCV
jgi:methylenetetrahydrofolate reductase (NADPH)